MPLPLLHPRLDLAMLERMDRDPWAAADWLIERYEDRPDDLPVDVLLMFCQGFHATEANFRDNRLWHLPKPTLELWSGLAYSLERRQAVEAWRVKAVTAQDAGFEYRLQVNKASRFPPHDQFWHTEDQFGDQPSADREMRRRVARLFPEVRRFVPFDPDAPLPDGSLGWYVCERCGDMGQRWLNMPRDCRKCGTTFIRKRRAEDGTVVQAWEFVPPESNYTSTLFATETRRAFAAATPNLLEDDPLVELAQGGAAESMRRALAAYNAPPDVKGPPP